MTYNVFGGTFNLAQSNLSRTLIFQDGPDYDHKAQDVKNILTLFPP